VQCKIYSSEASYFGRFVVLRKHLSIILAVQDMDLGKPKTHSGLKRHTQSLLTLPMSEWSAEI
jgi:hypothetical protein